MNWKRNVKNTTVKKKLAEIVTVLRKNERFVITGHEKPDGDCLGSQIGLADLLRRWDKQVYLVNADLPGPVYQILPHLDWFSTKPPDQPVDIGIVTDSGDINRTGSMADYLSSLDFLINLDHHPQNDSLGDLNLVDPGFSCVGEIVYELYRHVDEPISKESALALYVSLLTDTGSFRHANTHANSHRMAADLIEAGDLETYKIYRHIYEQESFESTRLLGEILSGIQRDGGVVWGEVPRQLFDRTGTTERDLNDVINYLRRIKPCEVAILFREREDGTVKINFRSKGNVDLLDVVEQFGGGGHQQAAGAMVEGDITDVRETVIHALKQEVERVMGAEY